MDAPKSIRISWSSLASHEKCSNQAYLSRRQKRAPATDIRVFYPGIVCDRIMRHWLEQYANSPNPMVSYVEQFMEQCEQRALEKGDGVVRWKGPKDKSNVASFCRSLLRKLEPMLERLVTPYEYMPEYRFQVPMHVPSIYGNGNMMVQLIGGMDILVRDQDKDAWYIYDLKATKNSSYASTSLGQLVFYALSLKALRGVTAAQAGFIQPAVSKQELVRVAITDDALNDMASRVTRMASDMVTSNYGTVDKHGNQVTTDVCRRCQVSHACERYTRTEFVPVVGRKQSRGRVVNI